MSEQTLTLGPVVFEYFEIPAAIQFGGSQRLAVHRLSTGTRVTEILGSDDADIVFSGILSGRSATERCHELNALRRLGRPLQLSWNSYAYVVLIREFQANYANAWWIPYRIVCSVIDDASVGLPEQLLSGQANAVASIEQLQGILPTAVLPLSAISRTLQSPGIAAKSGTSLSAALNILQTALATVSLAGPNDNTIFATAPLNSTMAPPRFLGLFGAVTDTAYRLQYVAAANAYVGQAVLYLTEDKT